MATIGLDKLYYATITEDPSTGAETYGKPLQRAKAIYAELEVRLPKPPCMPMTVHRRWSGVFLRHPHAGDR